MKPYPITLLFLLFLLPGTRGLAAEQSWLMSIPYAMSSEHIYKVVIESIDGQATENAVRYPVAVGDHTISVRLLLDVEWSPDLVETPGPLRQKQLVVSTRAGETYQIAARLDIDAPAQSQLNDTFWEPFVYRILAD